jgi:hypothetical protein
MPVVATAFCIWATSDESSRVCVDTTPATIDFAVVAIFCVSARMPAGASFTKESQRASYCFIYVMDAGIVSPGDGQPNVSLVRVAGFDLSALQYPRELATIASCAAWS